MYMLPWLSNAWPIGVFNGDDAYGPGTAAPAAPVPAKNSSTSEVDGGAAAAGAPLSPSITQRPASSADPCAAACRRIVADLSRRRSIDAPVFRAATSGHTTRMIICTIAGV